MRRRKGWGFYAGRYVVAPLLLVIIIVGLAWLLGLLISGLWETVSSWA